MVTPWLDEQHDKGRREVKTTTDGMIVPAFSLSDQVHVAQNQTAFQTFCSRSRVAWEIVPARED
jgi:hypothetical protein